MKDVVIIAGVRTPIGNFGGALKDIPAQKLGELVVREVMTRTALDPALIDEVIVGCVGQFTDAANIARVIALLAGLPVRIPAYSVQRNCSSGLQPFANASLSSISSRSSRVTLARFSANGRASAGPIPIRVGSTPIKA